MNGYEELRQRHVSEAVRLAPGLIEQLDWSAERLAAYRSERLRALVRAAVDGSPWHRKRLRDLDPDACAEATLGDLPVMTKNDLMEHFDEIVTDNRVSLDAAEDHLAGLPGSGYLLDRYTAIASSGSTGRRGVFVYDWDGWAVFYLLLFRYVLRQIATDPELQEGRVVMANVAASHPTHATANFSRTFAGPHLESLRFPVTLPLEEIVAGLNEAQPTFLHAYPSALHLLTQEARAGRLRIAPRRILASSEPLLPEIRRAAEEMWKVPVGNWWGCSEGGGMAAACERGGTHLSEDMLIIEPVDQQGRPVPPGTPAAKIYLTNLYNRLLPLIRYEITDEVTILEEPCPCGSGHRCIGDIQGRLDDMFFYGDRCVHPHVFRSHIGRRAAIVDYQVRQTPRGADVAVRIEGRIALDRVREELEEALLRLGVDQPEVTITPVDHLERGATGKLKRFLPLPASA